MKEKFDALMDKKNKTLHDKMLLKAIYLIAAIRKLEGNEQSLNTIYCDLEKRTEKMGGE